MRPFIPIHAGRWEEARDIGARIEHEGACDALCNQVHILHNGVTTANSSLPSFRKPPVVEVAVGIQFEPIERLRNPHLGLLWSRFRESFPKVEDHHPRPPVSESFEPDAAGQRLVRLQLLDVPDVSRSWFVSEHGHELIQVQQDRFVFNWRRQGPEPQYPRYAYVRGRFTEALGVFRQFLLDEDLGHLVPNQSEVLYVNHILPGGIWTGFDSLSEVIPSWEPRFSESFLPGVEDVRFTVRYRIPDGGQPQGRLHIAAAPGHDRDGKAILVLQLTARGRPKVQTIESALSFLDTGREWIVRGFTAFTSPEMHREWERTNGS
jgi:uncharacterized protein (TIGR04255 family)